MRKNTKDRVPLPQLPGLAIGVTCPLSVSVAYDLEDFHADCLGVEAAIADLQADRRDLLDGALDATLRDLMEDGGELEHRRHELERNLLSLHWRRLHLLSSLLPDFQRAVEVAALEHDRVMEQTIAEMRRTGADCSIQALANRQAAVPSRLIAGIDAQVTCAAYRQLPVIHSAGQMNLAKDALDALRSEIGVPPYTKNCEIMWQSTGPQFAIAEQVLRQLHR